MQADFVGPLQLGSGNKLICVLIECFLKHIWACPTKGCSDADLMDGLMHVEQTYGAIPKRLQVDGALCKPLTLSKQYLDRLGVNLYHGHPRISRNQLTVERAISTLMWTLTKLSTALPTKSMTQLLKSAVSIYNSTPSPTLNGQCPFQIIYNKSPINLFTDSSILPTNLSTRQRAQREDFLMRHNLRQDVLKTAVANHNRRQPSNHEWDYNSKPRPGTLCFKKRTSFATTMNKKYQYQVEFIGYRIISRAATNVFKVENIEDGGISYISGDHLIVTSLSEAQMKELIVKLRRLDEPTQPTGPVTRSATASEIKATVKLASKVWRRDKRKANSERRKVIKMEGGVPDRCYDVYDLYDNS